MAKNFYFSLVSALVVLSCFAITSDGALFSSLHQTLILNSSSSQGQVVQAGEGQVRLTWSFNKSNPVGTDSNYNIVKVKLCYAPVSQVDRGWRKTVDNLRKDKTCQFNVVTMPYKPENNSFSWNIERDVPSATYFLRAYVYDYAGEEVAFGQTTDGHKKTNLFQIVAITGRHVTLDICSALFSAFSFISLIGFFFVEKRKTQQK